MATYLKVKDIQTALKTVMIAHINTNGSIHSYISFNTIDGSSCIYVHGEEVIIIYELDHGLNNCAVDGYTFMTILKSLSNLVEVKYNKKELVLSNINSHLKIAMTTPIKIPNTVGLTYKPISKTTFENIIKASKFVNQTSKDLQSYVTIAQDGIIATNNTSIIYTESGINDLMLLKYNQIAMLSKFNIVEYAIIEGGFVFRDINGVILICNSLSTLEKQPLDKEFIMSLCSDKSKSVNINDYKILIQSLKLSESLTYITDSGTMPTATVSIKDNTLTYSYKSGATDIKEIISCDCNCEVVFEISCYAFHHLINNSSRFYVQDSLLFSEEGSTIVAISLLNK